MLKENLNSLIMESMKAHDKINTETLRAVKTAIMQWETAKENVGKTYDEGVEVSILRKLQQQYNDTAEMCNDGKHDEMVTEARKSSEIVGSYLPAPVTREEIVEWFNVWKTLQSNTGLYSKNNMGFVIKTAKEHFPTADGKIIADVVKGILV